jgi:hypothetical protein
MVSEYFRFSYHVLLKREIETGSETYGFNKLGRGTKFRTVALNYINAAYVVGDSGNVAKHIAEIFSR